LSKGGRFVFVATGDCPGGERSPELAACCLVLGIRYWGFPKGGENVGKYTLEQLIEYWRTEQVTVEQAIGQILQFLLEYRQRIAELEKRLWEVERKSE
jgi:hypothetical protein